MILFYSDSCQHCSVLLDTIKRHDTKKMIKLVCIDTRIQTIKDKITKVPALMFLPNKEIIYGKAVFDHLLLPNRGILFTSNSTRDKSDNNQNSSLTAPVPLNNQTEANEPLAFSLGSIMSDKFSDINDDNVNSVNLNSNRVYGWDLITNDNQNKPPPPADINSGGINTRESKSDKKLPSIEELTKERENLFKDIK
jgi:hypothetical protein